MIAKSVSEVMEIAEQIQRQHYGPISDQMVYKKIKEIYPEEAFFMSEEEQKEEVHYIVEETKTFQNYMKQAVFKDASQEEIVAFAKEYVRYGAHQFINCLGEEEKRKLLEVIENSAAKFYLVSGLTDEEKTPYLREYEGETVVRLLRTIKESERIPYILEVKDKLARATAYRELAPEVIMEYMKSCPENYEPVLMLGEAQVKELFSNIEDDFYKTKILIEFSLGRDEVKKVFSELQDDYCKIKLIEYGSQDETHCTKEDVLDCLNQYFKNKTILSQMENEEEKAEYIAKLQENEMKVCLLEEITERKNRDRVIQSLTHHIDPELQMMTRYVQTMIQEFITDTYQPEQIPEKIEEKMKIVFARTNVSYKEYTDATNGTADYINHDIGIAHRRRFQQDKVLGCMIHEYAHLFSNFDFKKDPFQGEKAIEEGNADTFAELVVRHYLEKHPNELPFSIKEPYTIYSTYDFENSWARTLLYPLEEEQKDKKAIVEYLLGEKTKYLEMVIGTEYAQSVPTNTTDNMNEIPITYEQLYKTHEESFKEIRTDSIYYNRNSFLPAFQIQRKVGDRAETKVYELKGRKWNETFMASTYFEDRTLEQIKPEELEEFITLVSASNCNGKSFFTPIEPFAMMKIQELEKRRSIQSTPVLANTVVMMNQGIKIGSREIEDFMLGLIDRQIQKVEDGLDIAETRKIVEKWNEKQKRENIPEEMEENLEDAFSSLSAKLEIRESKTVNPEIFMEGVFRTVLDPKVQIAQSEMQLGIRTIKQELQNMGLVSISEKEGENGEENEK